jgi:hypothetical protein
MQLLARSLVREGALHEEERKCQSKRFKSSAQRGPDTKTNWRTDRRSQYNSNWTSNSNAEVIPNASHVTTSITIHFQCYGIICYFYELLWIGEQTIIWNSIVLIGTMFYNTPLRFTKYRANGWTFQRSSTGQDYRFCKHVPIYRPLMCHAPRLTRASCDPAYISLCRLCYEPSVDLSLVCSQWKQWNGFRYKHTDSLLFRSSECSALSYSKQIHPLLARNVGMWFLFLL